MDGTRAPVAFWEEVVAPALFEALDQAFPEFGWRRQGAGWVSTERVQSLGAPRPGRVVCNQPYGVLVHGGAAMSWPAYITGGQTPRGADFVEAVLELARRAGVDPVPMARELTPEEAEAHDRRARRANLLETFVAQAQEALGGPEPEAQTARALLVDRGFPEGNLGLGGLAFGLYTTPADVRQRLEAVGFTPADVEAAGLVADGRWAGRVVLPWRDGRGRIATVAARAVGAAEEGAKYLYLKGGTKPEAFGLEVALRAGGREELVLVEGLFDVVALQAAGLPNVAALGGTGDLLNAERWAALARAGVRRAVLVLDNDAAGRAGLLKALRAALTAETVPEVWAVDPALLGAAKDPDGLLRAEGPPAVAEVLAQRVSAAVYLGREALGEVTAESPDAERRAAVAAVLELVQALRGPGAHLEAEDLLRRTAERVGYSPEALEAEALDHVTRRREEEGRTALQRALEAARFDLGRGVPVYGVAADLATAAATVRPAIADRPRPWDVDRLIEESAETPLGRSSGWEALDDLEVTFHPGELALLAARTGHGKTSALVGLLHNWLVQPEVEEGELLVFYSSEEPEVRVFQRLLALETGWPSTDVRDALRERPLGDYLSTVVERVREWRDRLLVIHRPSWSVAEVVAYTRELDVKRPVGAVLVDYLQRIAPPEGRYDRRDIEVSQVGRWLKALAVDLDAPVAVAAQLGRQAVEGAERLPDRTYEDQEVQRAIRRRRPQLHHLREGGSEQEADLVLGLLSYRADYTAGEEREDGRERSVPEVTRLEVGTLKNRYGSPGRWAALAFEGRYGLIRDPGPGEVL